MHDKGFTMVPNAIIRSSVLTTAEKAVWCYIASLPDGYRYSVCSACKTLHICERTWRKSVSILEERGLISVRNLPGQTKAFLAVKDASCWELSPGKIAGCSNDTPSKIAAPPLANEQVVPPYYKKKHLNNNVDDDTRARTRESFEKEVMIDANIELACMSCGITPAQYKELAEQIIAEWKFKDLPNDEWTKNHFMSVLRHKVKDLKNNNDYERHNQKNSTEAESNPLSRARIHTAKIG